MDIRDIIEDAKAARLKAHAPYSGFSVGAAVRDEHGRIHAGCNVENASYPQGWCAEASAIAALILAGGRRITEVVVVVTGHTLCTPCGGCRQKIREFAGPETRIHCCSEAGEVLHSFTLEDLLPFSFGPQNLA